MAETNEYRADAVHTFATGPDLLYQAWTQRFDAWFATPGTLTMRAQVGEPFHFDVVYDGQRHPHYGKFVALVPDRVVDLTWVTGQGGTDGAETRVRVEFTPNRDGTRLILAQTGFYTEAAARAAHDAWPHVLIHLDEVLTGSAGN
jgi:uncharacterized protein YndB with AHSA1/START domain